MRGGRGRVALGAGPSRALSSRNPQAPLLSQLRVGVLLEALGDQPPPAEASSHSAPRTHSSEGPPPAECAPSRALPAGLQGTCSLPPDPGTPHITCVPFQSQPVPAGGKVFPTSARLLCP